MIKLNIFLNTLNKKKFFYLKNMNNSKKINLGDIIIGFIKNYYNKFKILYSLIIKLKKYNFNNFIFTKFFNNIIILLDNKLNPLKVKLYLKYILFLKKNIYIKLKFLLK